MALLQKDVEYLRRDNEIILARFTKHMDDAERAGGWHDRMKDAEAGILAQKEALATFRKFQLLYSAIGGIVGGLVGSGSPGLVMSILRHWGIAP
jgi:hypothetical protein